MTVTVGLITGNAHPWHATSVSAEGMVLFTLRASMRPTSDKPIVQCLFSESERLFFENNGPVAYSDAVRQRVAEWLRTYKSLDLLLIQDDPFLGYGLLLSRMALEPEFRNLSIGYVFTEWNPPELTLGMDSREELYVDDVTRDEAWKFGMDTTDIIVAIPDIAREIIKTDAEVAHKLLTVPDPILDIDQLRLYLQQKFLVPQRGYWQAEFGIGNGHLAAVMVVENQPNAAIQRTVETTLAMMSPVTDLVLVYTERWDTDHIGNAYRMESQDPRITVVRAIDHSHPEILGMIATDAEFVVFIAPGVLVDLEYYHRALQIFRESPTASFVLCRNGYEPSMVGRKWTPIALLGRRKTFLRIASLGSNSIRGLASNSLSWIQEARKAGYFGFTIPKIWAGSITS